MPGTRKLSRPTAHRMSMLRGLVTALIEHERVETTVTRAKDAAALCEKMISLGKEGTLAARRRAMAFVTKEDAVRKLFEELAHRFEDRGGGYTRVTRVGPRRGDAAEMAVLEILDQ